MSDRSPMEVEVFGMSSRAARVAVLEVLSGECLTSEWDGDPVEELDADELGEHVLGYDTQAPLGTPEALAAALEAIPGITFRIHQDARYESDGQTIMYAPELGRYESAGSNTDGEPFVFTDDIDKVLASVRGLVAVDSRDPELLSALRGVVEALDHLSGRAHRERIEALRAARNAPANG